MAARQRPEVELITGDPDGDGFEIPAYPPALWKASSTVVWRTVAALRGALPMFWPVYPNHPHEPGRPATKRPPRAAEIAAARPSPSH
ncbi:MULTISPECIES: hypothetical protein [unclassified Streptomyces]|uniref:hypothetical protein n=1 Tax=unclassified Streptomyces TaxID=2593676 RepID=UPI002E3096A0|nr:MULTISPECIES: hypothetical protein [unclassified Streptomyces]